MTLLSSDQRCLSSIVTKALLDVRYELFGCSQVEGLVCLLEGLPDGSNPSVADEIDFSQKLFEFSRVFRQGSKRFTGMKADEIEKEEGQEPSDESSRSPAMQIS
jgi:hypothetical protein